MDPTAIDEFLEAQGVGTLAFGDESGGYAIPMSFGYDSSQDRCILQVSFGEESTKAHYIEQDTQVALSVFEWTAVDDWRSVVIQGTLQRIPDSESTTAAGIFAAHAKIASLDVFKQPLEDLDLEWYQLDIDTIEGRTATK